MSLSGAELTGLEVEFWGVEGFGRVTEIVLACCRCKEFES